jgi:branched-chain amino acid transport system ATP-binding protein
VQQIFSIIEEINRRGTTVLLVEQNAQQALQIAHRAYVLETGRVVKSAPAGELLDDPQVRAAYLGGESGGDLGGTALPDAEPAEPAEPAASAESADGAEEAK